MKKLLNNPKFISGLAVVAVTVVIWSSTKGLRRTRSTVNPAAAAAAAKTQAIAVANAAEAAKNTAKTDAERKAGALVAPPGVALPEAPVQFGIVPPFAAIDGARIRERIPEWLESPTRDPFSLAPGMVQSAPGAAEKPSVLLRLKSIWRQTGGAFAVINDTIVKEGDLFLGLKVASIDAGAVTLVGDRGSQRLEFPSANPAPPATNPPPVAPPAHLAPASSSTLSLFP